MKLTEKQVRHVFKKAIFLENFLKKRRRDHLKKVNLTPTIRGQIDVTHSLKKP
jgi:hypothetical protein